MRQQIGFCADAETGVVLSRLYRNDDGSVEHVLTEAGAGREGDISRMAMEARDWVRGKIETARKGQE